MSYVEQCEEAVDRTQFGFKLQKTAGGWEWVAFDSLGRIADCGMADTRAEAAALIIRALART